MDDSLNLIQEIKSILLDFQSNSKKIWGSNDEYCNIGSMFIQLSELHVKTLDMVSESIKCDMKNQP